MYMSLCSCVHVLTVVTDAGRGCRDSGAGVTNGCQQPDMGGGN